MDYWGMESWRMEYWGLGYFRDSICFLNEIFFSVGVFEDVKFSFLKVESF